MKMKKILSLLLVAVMAVALFAGCGGGKEKETTKEADWKVYDALISEIKSMTDFEAREAKMHEAEDMLMETGALVPLYYYNDVYMVKPTVQGFYANAYGNKFFMYCTNGDSDTLRINLASEPDKLDPALNSSVDGACLAINSFSGLFTYNAEGQQVPALVETYTVSEDGKTYVFTLKDDLKWSDGSALTAADFEYAWKRAASAETGADYSYMFNGIEGYGTDNLNVKASEDGKTFTVVLSAPCAYFLDLCAFPTFLPVKQSEVEGAKGYLDADGNISNPGAWALEAGFICNGAYTLKEWKHDESMVYVKNPYYYDAENVKIEKLEFMLSADDVAIFAAYNAGSLDFIDSVPNNEIPNLLDNPEFNIVDELGTYYICFNVKSDLFAGKTVAEANAMRRGLSLLIDRERIAVDCGQTGQQPANAFIPAKMLDGHGGEFKKSDDAYKYPVEAESGYFTTAYGDETVAEAIKLLEEAGFKFENGKLSADTPISFEYLTNDGTGHIAIAECVKQDLAVIGVDMSIKTVDWDTFLNERKSGNYDIARNGWIADFNDPINMLEMWTTDSGNNDCQFGK